MNVIEILTTSPDATARFLAAQQLGDARDRTVVDALIRVAESDSNDEVREEAIYALTKIGDPRAIPTLQHIFVTADRGTYEYKLAIAAYGALEQMGAPIPAPPPVS